MYKFVTQNEIVKKVIYGVWILLLSINYLAPFCASCVVVELAKARPSNTYRFSTKNNISTNFFLTADYN